VKKAPVVEPTEEDMDEEEEMEEDEDDEEEEELPTVKPGQPLNKKPEEVKKAPEKLPETKKEVGEPLPT
jgi:hypothetical protein